MTDAKPWSKPEVYVDGDGVPQQPLDDFDVATIRELADVATVDEIAAMFKSRCSAAVVAKIIRGATAQHKENTNG